ncbi:MAG: hypothetical protein OXE99_05825 [Cellvibrionales bacterium]|nr:hypothetical protein [Cellvibrionales bacterium]
MPLLNRIYQLITASAVLAFVGCKAPEDVESKTSLSIISPWDKQADKKPVIDSVNTRVELSYTLSDTAVVQRDNIYEGTARFALLVNGIDVTDRQRKADCSMPVRFFDGTESTPLDSDDAIACYEDLQQQMQGTKIASGGVAYDSGFMISNLGLGGVITFQDLQTIQSTFIPGENVITLKSLNNSEEASVSFIYTAQPVQMVVADVIPANASGLPMTAGDGYDVTFEIKSQTGLKLDKDNNYIITFYDRNSRVISNDRVSITENGRRIEVTGLTYPDLSTSVAEKPEIRYELTDELDNKQNKGFIFSGQKLDRFFALQLNGSFFGAFKKPVDVMIDTIVNDFVDIFALAAPSIGIETGPGQKELREGTISELKPGESVISIPEPFADEVNTYMKAACDNFFTNTSVEAKDRRCAFFAEILPPTKEAKTNLGFSKDEENSEFVFDIIFDDLNVKIDIAAYETQEANLYPDIVNPGRYLGSFKTTISFNDLVLRDTFTVSTSNDSLITGITNRNGYVMRYGNQIQQRIGEILSSSDSTFRPKLMNSSCPGNICLVDAGLVEFLGDIPSLSEGLIFVMESQLNRFLPDITESLLMSFPDVGGVKKSVTDNTPDQVVKSYANGNVLRNMTANFVEVKDINPFTDLNPFQSIFKDIGRNWAGRMLFSGNYESQYSSVNDVVSGKDLLTPFVASDAFSHFQWGHKINVGGVDKQIDAVASLSLNALNQYIAADFQVSELAAWLTESFLVNSSDPVRRIETLSKMVRTFDQSIGEGDDVQLAFTMNRSPELVFIGEKVPKYQFSYSLLGGLISGGTSDEQITPAIKMYFNDVDVVLTKQNNADDEQIFSVNADFSVEVNIGFENGLPKLYVKTPQPPQALYEDEPEKRLDKQMVIHINRVNYLTQKEIDGTVLADKAVNGVPLDPEDLHLKVKISNAFSGTYRQQIEEYYSEGIEEFFDDLVAEFLADNFNEQINFRDYTDLRCPQYKVQLLDKEGIAEDIAESSAIAYRKKLPDTLSEGQKDLLAAQHKAEKKADILALLDPIDADRTLMELYTANAIVVEGQVRWFTTDEAGAWLTMGLDFQSRELGNGEVCEDNMGPLSVCFTEQPLNTDPLCRFE